MRRIIDMHCHIYPDKIADKATKAIGEFYDIPMFHTSGSCANLINSLKNANIQKALVCSVATTPHQVISINNFIHQAVSEHKDIFVGFGTLHPDFEDIESEINRIISLGLKGIKFHSDFQKFNIDAPKAMEIYEIVEDRLPILLHMGDDRFDYSTPKRLANVLKAFPKLKVIGAHFGGYTQWDDAAKYLSDYSNIMVDTSSSMPMLGTEKSRELAKIWGIDRIMFGSDFPMWNHIEELERAAALGIEGEENLDKYYYLNGAKLLGIE